MQLIQVFDGLRAEEENALAPMATPQQIANRTCRAGFDYQSLIRLIAVQTATAGLLRLFQRALLDPEAPLLNLIGFSLAGCAGLAGFFAARKVHRVAVFLGASHPALWAGAAIIPFLGVAVLLMLSGRMHRLLRARGIPVGILGPSDESLYAFAERESQAAKRLEDTAGHAKA